MTATAHATFGRAPADGLFALTLMLDVSPPGLDTELAAGLIQETEEICPYAEMSLDGIHHDNRVNVSVTP